jgi:DNA-binding transcriptional ArsR family regulator
MDSSNLLAAFGALAQDTRLQVFRLLLGAGPEGLPAGEVARRLGTPHNTMSTHLAILSRAGLARCRRESRQVIYSVDLGTVRGLVAFLVQECCGGQPERCAALLDAAIPVPSCRPGCAA